MNKLTLKTYIDFIVDELWLQSGRYKTYTNKLYAIEEMIGDSIFYLSDDRDKLGSATLYFFTDLRIYEIRQDNGYVVDMISKKSKFISKTEYIQNEEDETKITLNFADCEEPIILNSHEYLSSETQSILMEIFKLYS